MNNWKDLENQLRSWTLRAPSERVKGRLFGAGGAGATAVDPRAWTGHPTWHWLASAMSMFVLGLFIAGRNPGGLGATSGVLAELSMGEPERTSFYMKNSVQVTTFDWTNRGHSLTTAAPVAPTNSLFQ